MIDNNNAGSSGGHGGNAGIASDISNSDQLRINALEGKLSGVAKAVETINTTLLTLTQTLVQMQTKLDAPHIRQESAVQLPTSAPPPLLDQYPPLPGKVVHPNSNNNYLEVPP